MAEDKKPRKPKSAKSEQINRSLGYLVSIATDAKTIYTDIRTTEPWSLVNPKLLRRLAATLHVIHKVKEGRAPNDATASQD